MYKTEYILLKQFNAIKRYFSKMKNGVYKISLESYQKEPIRKIVHKEIVPLILDDSLLEILKFLNNLELDNFTECYQFITSMINTLESYLNLKEEVKEDE